MPAVNSTDILRRLRGEISSLEGYGRDREAAKIETGLGCLEGAFPEGRFPRAGVHEFLSSGSEQAAATTGFISALAAAFLQSASQCLWISATRQVYPPALAAFGLRPDRIIFIHPGSDREALWAIEEALKCDSLPAVIAELRDLDFTQSRRLQLAVESSGVTAFIHRKSPRQGATTASLTRWAVSPVSSQAPDNLPGLGFPRWNVQLLKVRNGRPGAWQLEWGPDGFRHVPVFKAVAGNPIINQTA